MVVSGSSGSMRTFGLAPGKVSLRLRPRTSPLSPGPSPLSSKERGEGSKGRGERCVDNRDPDRVVGQPGRAYAGRRAPDLKAGGVGPLAGVFDEEGGAAGGSTERRNLRCGWLGQDHAWDQEREDEKNTEREALLGHGSASLPRLVPNLRSGTGLPAAGRAGGSPAGATSAAGSAAGTDVAPPASMST